MTKKKTKFTEKKGLFQKTSPSQKNNSMKYYFYTYENKTKNKHTYENEEEAKKARMAFIEHTNCRKSSGVKPLPPLTLTYDTYDFKTDKIKTITVSPPTYTVGPLEVSQ